MKEAKMNEVIKKIVKTAHRPVCSLCNSRMVVVRVNSSRDTNYYFYCKCIYEYWIEEEYDEEIYMD